MSTTQPTQLLSIAHESSEFLSGDKSIATDILDDPLRDFRYEDIADQYEEAGFIFASKLVKIAANNYKYFSKNDLKNFMYSAASKNGLEYYDPNGHYTLDRRSIHKLEEGLEDYITGERVSLENIEIPNTVVNIYTVYADSDYGLHTVRNTAITEEILEEYAHIPPIEVTKKVKKARDLNIFDEFTVLDIENKEMFYESNIDFIDDPVVCGKLKEKPDMYFFVEAWLSNLPVNSILNQENIKKLQI